MSDFVNKPGRGNASKMKPEWLQKDFEELKAKNFDWFNKMSEAEQKDYIPKYKGEIVLNVPEGMSGDVQFGIKVNPAKNKNGETYLKLEGWVHRDQPYQSGSSGSPADLVSGDFDDDIPF